VREVGEWSARRVVLPAPEADLIPGTPKLLGDPVADWSWPHDDQRSRCRPGGVRCAPLGDLGRGDVDCFRQAVHDRCQLSGVARWRMAREPMLGFTGDRAELQKPIGSAGSGQPVQPNLERIHGVPMTIPELGDI